MNVHNVWFSVLCHHDMVWQIGTDIKKETATLIFRQILTATKISNHMQIDVPVLAFRLKYQHIST